MYLDALSFLEDERDGWRPFEALDALTDARLEAPVPEAHGWSGRDLMGHLLGWLELSLAVARELAIGEHSATLERFSADLAARGEGGLDAVNGEWLAAARARPLDELRAAFRSVPGELRGYLTVVPESRWIKHPRNQEVLFENMTNHYEDHLADLRAILAAAEGSA